MAPAREPLKHAGIPPPPGEFALQIAADPASMIVARRVVQHYKQIDVAVRPGHTSCHGSVEDDGD